MDISNLEKGLMARRREYDRLSAMRDHYVKEKSSCIIKMGEAQCYLDSKDEVIDILNELHQRTQVRTKEIYEQLLTTLVQEMKPGDPENDRVVLETEIKRNRTSLEIGMRNDKGCVRNIYLDKGGSVENIVAMGLRFIAVSRTSNRRLIVMDEADSALRSEYIPIFAAIMDQLARQIGMQVIYISHHPVSSFEGKARIIHLQRENGYVSAEQVSDVAGSGYSKIQDKIGSDLDENEDIMEGVGLRYIRLVNNKQHENTMIELSPYVNVITADIDVGKSTIVQAIEAVAHNLGREGLIRDGQSMTRVEIGLEDGMTLQWSYSRKGSKKTSYVLTNANNEVVNSSDNGTEVPEWLHDYLSMAKHQDFDLHISDQHNSSFILDKRISSFRRAELLSLGKEATQVQKMITQHGERSDKCRRVLNECKKELVIIKNKLIALRAIGTVEERITELEALLQSIKDGHDNHKWLSNNIPLIMGSLGKVKALSPLSLIEIPKKEAVIDLKPIRDIAKSMVINKEKKSLLSLLVDMELPRAPVINPLSEMLSLGQGIGIANRKLAALDALSDIKLPAKPDITETSTLGNIYRRIEKSLLFDEVMASLNITMLKKPDLEPTGSYLESGKALVQKEKQVEQLTKLVKESEAELHLCIETKNEFISSLGGMCPLCHNHIKGMGANHE